MKGLVLGVALLALAGCGGGSSSSGNHAPLKAVCQTCTYDNECESDQCSKFTSGMWRCVPKGTGPGYRCPGGQYKLMDEGCE
jgi:hypothetical protein